MNALVGCSISTIVKQLENTRSSFYTIRALTDEMWGEVPCAFVELKADAEVSESELIDYYADNIARFK